MWYELSDYLLYPFFFYSSRSRHTRLVSDWSSDVCSSDLVPFEQERDVRERSRRDEGDARLEQLGQQIGGVRSHRRSEEHTSELQSLTNLVCRLLLEKKKITEYNGRTITMILAGLR